VRVQSLTEAEALEASRRKLMKAGWRDDGRIVAVDERPAKSGRDMMIFIISVRDTDDSVYELRDYLTDSKLCAARLRHVCAVCEVLPKYEAHEELLPSDFIGRAVRVCVGVEKGKPGSVYGDRNVVTDYALVPASVVTPLRVA
jgi:hypothetical protein